MVTHDPVKTLLVELVGVPGSGKSVIARELGRMLAESGYSVATQSAFYRYGKFARRLLPPISALVNRRSLGMLARFMVLFLKSFAKRRKEWMTCTESWVYYMALKEYLMRWFLLKKEAADIFIFDEAMINYLSAVDADEIDGVDWRGFLYDYYTQSASLAIIVSANVPLRVALDRARGDTVTNRFRILEMDKKNKEKFYENKYKNQERFLGFFRKRGANVAVLEVDAEVSPESNAAYIASEIKKRFSIPS